jgi:hypothetical protein
MKVLRKIIQNAIAQDAAYPLRGEYNINLYKPKKDNGFLSYVARKNPFAYYLLQTNVPNETINDDSFLQRVKRVFTGSKTRKMDPNTGMLSNNDFGITRMRNYYGDNPLANSINLYEIRKSMNKFQDN